MGFLGINDWGDAANAATVAGTIAAVLLGILAVRQYLRDSFLHQDSIANEKLNEIYRLALAEPDLAEGEYDPDAQRFAARQIRLQRARVTVQIFLRSELQRVDENADRHRVRMLAGHTNQGFMSLVQRAHGRNQRQRFAP